VIGWLINRLSGYQRDRVYTTALYASERTRLVTVVSGLLGTGETIASATWLTFDVAGVYMSDAQIDDGGKSVSVAVRAQYSGRMRIRVDITTTAGREFAAWHVIQVKSAPYVGGENWTQGPERLEAVA